MQLHEAAAGIETTDRCLDNLLCINFRACLCLLADLYHMLHEPAAATVLVLADIMK